MATSGTGQISPLPCTQSSTEITRDLKGELEQMPYTHWNLIDKAWGAATLQPEAGTCATRGEKKKKKEEPQNTKLYANL